MIDPFGERSFAFEGVFLIRNPVEQRSARQRIVQRIERLHDIAGLLVQGERSLVHSVPQGAQRNDERATLRAKVEQAPPAVALVGFGDDEVMQSQRSPRLADRDVADAERGFTFLDQRWSDAAFVGKSEERATILNMSF